MTIPIIGTAYQIASRYRNAPKQVNQLMTDAFGGEDEDGIATARLALAQVSRGAQLYRQGKANWRVTDVTNVQAGARWRGVEIEATPDTLLKNVGLFYSRRAEAMASLKRDLALATALLAGLVTTSFFFNKTQWGKDLLSEVQKVKYLDRASDIIRQLTATKRAAIFSVGSCVLGGLLAKSAALRESGEARRSAVAYDAHLGANRQAGIECEHLALERQLACEGCPKTARYVGKMAG